MHCAHRHACHAFNRKPAIVFCSKGFGAAAPKQKAGKASRGTAKTPQQAADQALAEAAKSRPNVRPINPKEAARGKVDYVQVKDWADGNAADLGELQVLPDSYSTAYTAAGGSSSSSSAGGSSAAAAAAAEGPFYQQLARHAQYLESQGALSIALQPGAKPFLPFESWQYSLPRYRQYMAELAAVHLALEQALTLALAAPAPAVASSGSLSSISVDEAAATQQLQRQQQAWEVPGRSGAAAAAYAALHCFSAESGLWRGHAAQADLAALAELAAARHNDKQQQQQQQQQGKKRSEELHASQNAFAYGKYLLQLGRVAAAGTAAAAAAAASSSKATTTNTSSSSSSDTLLLEEDEGTAAALKLLAHAYALHVQQQCLGTRIGAAATDHLDLMTTGLPTEATATYMQYPQHVQEPLQQLVTVTNAAGQLLDAAGRQAVLDELPKALKKATLMLAPLATA